MHVIVCAVKGVCRCFVPGVERSPVPPEIIHSSEHIEKCIYKSDQFDTAALLSVDRFVLLNNFKPMFMQKCLPIINPLSVFLMFYLL